MEDIWTNLFEEFIVFAGMDWTEVTENWYRARLKPFGKYLMAQGVNHPDKLKVEHVKLFLADQRKKGLSWSTRNGTFTILQKLFRWLKTMQLIDQNFFEDPSNEFKRPRKPKQVKRSVPLEYVAKMIAAARQVDTISARRDEAIMWLLINTGMRRAEAVNLRLCDLIINPETKEGEVIIRGKYDNERRGFLVGITVEALEKWLAVRPETNCEAVFLSMPKNKRGLHQFLLPSAVNDMMIKYRKLAKLPPISMSPHKWRHTYATEFSGNDGNVFFLQQLMGHSDIEITKEYVMIPKDQLRRKAAQFGPLKAVVDILLGLED